MNLPTFLRKSDELTKQLSKEQLTVFIHEIARTLPEHKREIFLDTLTEASQNTAMGSPKLFLQQLVIKGNICYNFEIE